MYHLIFALQYLKTSYLLPLWFLDTSQRNELRKIDGVQFMTEQSDTRDSSDVNFVGGGGLLRNSDQANVEFFTGLRDTVTQNESVIQT